MQQNDNAQSIKKSKVITIVRLRPNLRNQEERQCISIQNDTTIEIEINGHKRVQKVQLALSPETTQRQIFSILQPLISKTMDGFNISLLTYGQTGSGKTHTMFGSDWNNIIKKQTNFSDNNRDNKKQQITFLRSIEQDQNYAGIIPRTVYILFDNLITKRKKFIKVYCSFMQIYNQQMADLLEQDQNKAQQNKLIIHENKQDGIYVEGLNQVVVTDPQQCLQLMRRGQKNRIVRQTHMNAKSSRSHTIFTLLIQEVFPAKKSYRRMKINLCDLAGSQKIHKGEAMTGAHFQELKNINLSLTTLGKVIGALSTNKSIPPYRQSRLTRLLQDSLGGNTNTAIIATITSKTSCVQQSLNTLKFLERARQIKGEVVAKIYSDNPEMRNLQRQIHYLRDMLKMRGGHMPSDMELREKYKMIQQENQKLKEIVDQNMLQKLKRQNIHLKQQIITQANDTLSDSFVKMTQNRNNFKTVQHNQSHNDNSMTEELMKSISSQGNTKKFPIYHRKDETRSNAARTDDSSSHRGSTYQRGTGISMFPSLNKPGNKGTNKILDRILQIEKAKQQNRLKLQRQLQLLQRKQYLNQDEKKNTRVSKNK